MNAEKWKWKAAGALDHRVSPTVPNEPSNVVPDSKAPRVLTRALRTLSSSSMDSMAASSVRSNSSRRIQRTTSSNSSSMLDRLHRRKSRDSGLPDMPDSPCEPMQPYASMEVLHFGPLKADITLLKARSEYLVLTDDVLVRFGSGDAARLAFPQLNKTDNIGEPTTPVDSKPTTPQDVRIEIQLRSLVAAFADDGPNNRTGIEIWWSSPWPRLACSKTHLYFARPAERDAWLSAIHRACRPHLRKSSASSTLPDNLRDRIDRIVQGVEGQTSQTHQPAIFPVARAVFGSASKSSRLSSGEEVPSNTDTSSYFLVVGPCMCHLIEVLRADHGTPACDLRVKVASYGTVTLTRLRASVASHEHRFIMCFR